MLVKERGKTGSLHTRNPLFRNSVAPDSQYDLATPQMHEDQDVYKVLSRVRHASGLPLFADACCCVRCLPRWQLLRKRQRRRRQYMDVCCVRAPRGKVLLSALFPYDLSAIFNPPIPPVFLLHRLASFHPRWPFPIFSHYVGELF